MMLKTSVVSPRVLGVIVACALTAVVFAEPITSPITFNVFGRATRNAGIYTTSTAQIPEGVGAVGIKDTMTDAVASDTSNSFTLTVQVSPDGISWRGVHQEQWQGGTFFNRFTGQTVARHVDTVWSNSELQSGAWTGWFARAVLTQNNRMAVGFDCTVYPIGWTF